MSFARRLWYSVGGRIQRAVGLRMDQVPAPKAIKAQRLFLTTYGSGGRSGTVPVWFMTHEGRIYFTTRKASVKARRIQKNPRVTVRFGSPKAPPFEGKATWVEDPAIYDLLLPAYRRKYWYLSWFMGRRIRRRKERGESTAIEVSLESAPG